MYKCIKAPFLLFPYCPFPHFLSISLLSLGCPLFFSAPDPSGILEQLAEKLKLSDPLVLERRRGDRDPEPDWLVRLRRQHKDVEVSGVGQQGQWVDSLFSSQFP